MNPLRLDLMLLALPVGRDEGEVLGTLQTHGTVSDWDRRRPCDSSQSEETYVEGERVGEGVGKGVGADEGRPVGGLEGE